MSEIAVRLEDITRRQAWVPPVVVPTRWDRMEVILKIVERCNINCDYCYFFNADDDSYAQHPAYMRQATVEAVGDFLAKTAADSGLDELQIDFHGGEPTLLKKHRFAQMCDTLQIKLRHVPKLRFAVQTNAILIDAEWIALFDKYRVSVGVSLDGPPQFNDAHRLDHHGKGTYEATVRGIRLLSQARACGRLSGGLALICVADPAHDGRVALSHFVDDLKISNLHFVFPLKTHDGSTAEAMRPYAKYMCDIFDEWVQRADASINIRFIDTFLSLLVGGVVGLANYQSTKARSTAFTIASNGELGAADDDRVATYAFGNGVIASGGFGVSEFHASGGIRRYHEALRGKGARCETCCWWRVCEGGAPLAGNTQRFAAVNGFANHSVFCEGISALLVRMTQYALSKGVAFDRIESVLVTDGQQR